MQASMQLHNTAHHRGLVATRRPERTAGPVRARKSSPPRTELLSRVKGRALGSFGSLPSMFTTLPQRNDAAQEGGNDLVCVVWGRGFVCGKFKGGYASQLLGCPAQHTPALPFTPTPTHCYCLLLSVYTRTHTLTQPARTPQLPSHTCCNLHAALFTHTSLLTTAAHTLPVLCVGPLCLHSCLHAQHTYPHLSPLSSSQTSNMLQGVIKVALQSRLRQHSGIQVRVLVLVLVCG